MRRIASSHKRQSRGGLAFFFACLLVSLGACSRAGDEPGATCVAPPGLRSQAVSHVHDGDTLRLGDGQRVRLIGLNSPELGRDGRPDQPLAVAAREALERLAGERVLLRPGEDRRDRHGRLLAHAFTVDGASIEATLLRRGLAFHVAVAPNFDFMDCLREAEQAARAAGRGVWGVPAYRPLRAAELGGQSAGFLRVSGEVTRVSFKDNGWWIQLDGRVALRIDPEVQSLFDRAELRGLHGTRVTARGWLVPMGGWWQLRLSHPAMME